MAASLVAPACYYASAPATGEVPGGTDAQIASTEFPCEVAQVLATCWNCHTNPPKGGAPIPLTTRAELAAASSLGGTYAERALIRMRDTAKPMPPTGFPRPDAAGIDAFAAWVQSGMPMGSCEGVPGGGGVAPTVCSSGQKFPAVFDDGSPDMNPGLPCRACHLREEEDEARFFMGTVYPTLHEEDRCYSDVPTGTRVEIIDRNGVVALTLPVRPRGNFMSNSFNANVTLPFTARVVSPTGDVMQMTTPQMSGDCNGCHTEQGANGAPGRILLPSN
ncbi:MAG: hypothetical protein HOV81_31270 [Kofleriaceae bacterium]|nr:hypothetical protein [Kofleriaceae bacterium]